MEFVVSIKDFQKQIAIANQVITSKLSQPSLTNVLIQADQENQRVTFTGFDGFDLSFGIRTAIAAQVNEAGQIALPPKLLSDIVSRMSEGELHVSLVDGNCPTAQLKGAGTYQIEGMLADNYPELPDATATAQRVELPTDLLLQGIRGTLEFASTDETRQLLCGVHFKLRGKSAEFAATDGHRLSVWRFALGESEEDSEKAPEITVTVPAKALRALIKAGISDSASISLDNQQIVFRWGDNMLTSCLLQGAYPNYRQIFPRDFAITATCDRKALMSALERISVMAHRNKKIVRLAFNSGQSRIEIKADAPDFGSGYEEIPCQVNQDVAIALNAEYLLEGLSSIEAQEVLIQMNSPEKPVVIQSIDNDQHQHLLMPIQI